MSTPEAGATTREITFRDAIRDALTEEMERQPGMIIIGEDITPGGGTFGVHQGMAERFGERMIAASIGETCFDVLDGPVRRIGSPFVPKPSTPHLEKLAYPSIDQIVETVREMVDRKPFAKSRKKP